MNFTTNRINNQSKHSININVTENYRSVSLYNDIPQEELTFDEFEMFALDRLSLLRGIEKLKDSSDIEINDKIKKLEAKYMPIRSYQEKGADGKTEDERKDHLSHFILRLAYCRTEDLRRWFLDKECLLVKSRLLRLNEADRSKVMGANGLEYEQVDDISKNSRKELLVNVGGVKESDFIMSNFYKIPFQQAIQLISKREVYVEAGYAYVPLSKLIGIITSKFRSNLSKALVDASSAFEHVSSDPRIGPLLKNVHKQFVGNDFSKSSVVDKLTPDKVDQAAEVNMPLCMKTLQNSLKKDKHLKHWGRLQYGLFLKGAGLDLDAAQVFWEMHFTKLISHDDYIKKYSYTFRHMYGKEGARKNYTPFSCMKIIMGTPPEVGAAHGCPYRHMSNSALINSLNNLKISPSDVKDIVSLSKDQGHYQLACQKHFDISHPDHQKILQGGDMANHPNQWFQSSIQYYKIKNGESIKTTEDSDVTNENMTESSLTEMDEVISEEL